MADKEGERVEERGIGLMGISMGGYGALAIAERSPAKFRAVAAISPAVWTSYDPFHPGVVTLTQALPWSSDVSVRGGTRRLLPVPGTRLTGLLQWVPRVVPAIALRRYDDES